MSTIECSLILATWRSLHPHSSLRMLLEEGLMIRSNLELMTADGTIVSSIVDFQTIHAFLCGHVQPLRKKLRMLIAAEQMTHRYPDAELWIKRREAEERMKMMESTSASMPPPADASTPSINSLSPTPAPPLDFCLDRCRTESSMDGLSLIFGSSGLPYALRSDNDDADGMGANNSWWVYGDFRCTLS